MRGERCLKSFAAAAANAVLAAAAAAPVVAGVLAPALSELFRRVLTGDLSDSGEKDPQEDAHASEDSSGTGGGGVSAGKRRKVAPPPCRTSSEY